MVNAASLLSGPQGAYRDWVQPAHWSAHRRRSAARDASFLLPHLSEGMTLLDAGCGTAAISIGFADSVGPTGRVVGLDANEDALRDGRRLVADAGRAGTVELVVGSIYALPFPDGAFDAVYAHGVLQHLTHPLDGLRELRRVTRTGGVAGVVDVDTGSGLHWPADPVLERAVAITDTLVSLDSGWTFPDREGSNTKIGRRLRSLLIEAGFVNCTASAKAVCDGTPEAVLAAGEHEAALLEARPFVDYVSALGLATPGELAQMAARWRTWAREPGSFRAKLVCEALGWA